MKRTIIFPFLVLSGTFLFSQQSPEMYLASVPRYKGNSCEMTDADTANIRAFHKEMSDFRNTLSDDISRLKEAQEKFMENNEDQIRRACSDSRAILKRMLKN
ncbi:MAG: hypothetical protein IPH84_15595 [Bacteroidales bacterium]|nr:hypothetical protein [Bacteroidales bacterium]